jgi:hypothetical protein
MGRRGGKVTSAAKSRANGKLGGYFPKAVDVGLVIPVVFGRVPLDRVAGARKDPAAVSLGRRGGQVRSAAKTQSSRANGKKGGRPRAE